MGQNQHNVEMEQPTQVPTRSSRQGRRLSNPSNEASNDNQRPLSDDFEHPIFLDNPRGVAQRIFQWRSCFRGFCSRSMEKQDTEDVSNWSSSSSSFFYTDEEKSKPSDPESAFVYPPRYQGDDSSFRVVSHQKPAFVYIVGGPTSSLRPKHEAQPHKWHQEYLSPVSAKVCATNDSLDTSNVQCLAYLCFQVPDTVDRTSSVDTSLTSLSASSTLFMPDLSKSRPPTVVRNYTDSFKKPPLKPSRVGRSRSIAGEPLKPSLRIPRPRANTHESRASTIASSSSSHHRNIQFCFTPDSLREIHTLCDDDDVSTVASIDALQHNVCADPIRNTKQESWLQDWIEAGSLSSMAETSRVHDTEMHMAVSKWRTEHVYLPTFRSLEKDRQQPLLSGWLAFSSGNKLLRHLRTKRLISRDQIGYVTVYRDSVDIVVNREDGTHSGEASAENGARSLAFSTKDAYAEIQDVSLQKGRCVILKNRETHAPICTLMPVSLPRDYFKPTGELVAEHEFKSLASDMFRMVDNCYDHVAPVAQHEATLHVMFALDSWIRGRQTIAN